MDAVTLVKPDDGLLLWTFMIGWAAVSVWLEQKYRWAATLSGCMIALLGAMFAANLRIVPLDAPSYDAVWAYVVPAAVPLLLFDADIRRIKRESGSAFVAFHISTLGTMIGAAIAAVLFYSFIPEIRGVIAMFTGTYIGGSVNLAAMRDVFGVSPEMASASVVADNFLMAIYFFVLMIIPGFSFFRRRFRSRVGGLAEPVGSDEGTNAARFWERHNISLLDIATCAALTMVIVTASTKFTYLVNASGIPDLLKMLIGQKYLVITTLTVILATAFPSFFRGVHGARELGTFLIHIFFVVIGVPASLSMILERSPLLFVFASVIVALNLIVSLALGKLFNVNIEELVVCCNATIGGPTTAAAMCITKGWNDLIVPALLVGVWGYVLGNYCGVFMANALSYFFNLP
jgi:uncharacterized membrane protein